MSNSTISRSSSAQRQTRPPRSQSKTLDVSPRSRDRRAAPARRLRVDKHTYIERQAQVRPSEDGPDTTATLEPLTRATPQDWLGANQDPDVLLSVPNLGIDRITLKVKNLDAHVELHAKVLDLLELHVGADVGIEEVNLEIDNVRVQAILKVKLEKVVELVDGVVQLLDNHPEIVTNLTAGLGRGLERALAPSADHLEWSSEMPENAPTRVTRVRTRA
jgi:hypothetical protein